MEKNSIATNNNIMSERHNHKINQNKTVTDTNFLI